MKKIEEEKLKKINGGISDVVVTIVSTIVVFIIGVASGFMNPEKCN